MARKASSSDKSREKSGARYQNGSKDRAKMLRGLRLKPGETKHYLIVVDGSPGDLPWIKLSSSGPPKTEAWMKDPYLGTVTYLKDGKSIDFKAKGVAIPEPQQRTVAKGMAKVFKIAAADIAFKGNSSEVDDVSATTPEGEPKEDAAAGRQSEATEMTQRDYHSPDQHQRWLKVYNNFHPRLDVGALAPTVRNLVPGLDAWAKDRTKLIWTEAESRIHILGGLTIIQEIERSTADLEERARRVYQFATKQAQDRGLGIFRDIAARAGADLAKFAQTDERDSGGTATATAAEGPQADQAITIKQRSDNEDEYSSEIIGAGNLGATGDALKSTKKTHDEGKEFTNESEYSTREKTGKDEDNALERITRISDETSRVVGAIEAELQKLDHLFDEAKAVFPDTSSVADRMHAKGRELVGDARNRVALVKKLFVSLSNTEIK